MKNADEPFVRQAKRDLEMRHLLGFPLAAVIALILLGLSVLTYGGVAAAAGSLEVTPNSSLTNGSIVTVAGSGFVADTIGSVVECSNVADQPTINAFGSTLPVSCTSPVNKILETSDTGAFSVPFTVAEGTVGPPASGTDSSGGNAAADAADYPCPPTAAQVAAGDSCVIIFADEAGEQVSERIGFSPTVSSFSPTSGPVGTVVTIKGTSLVDASSVTFNGVAGTITKDTQTKIKVEVPSGATKGLIEVTTPGGNVESATKFKVT